MSQEICSPSPWKIDPRRKGGRYSIVDANGVLVIEVFHNTYAEVDANLIAAAPEMLEALELARTRIHCDTPDLPCHCDDCKTYDRIKTVIAKAKGVTS